MTKTSIEWATDVWNPVTGCTKVSQGCKHCYAERIASRFWGERKFTDVRVHPDRLDEPLHWRKPRRVFVNSMSDLFHEDVPDSFIGRVFGVMSAAYWHTFIVLTKRANRMYSYLSDVDMHKKLDPTNTNQRWQLFDTWRDIPAVLPNVWLLVSIEDQKSADERIPLLLQTPAAVRGVSYEPALGPVDFRPYLLADPGRPNWSRLNRLHWIIMGGESGPGARPMHPTWALSVRDQCQAAGVPFFFKQMGSAWANLNNTADRKGGEWDEWPDDLRIREYPKNERVDF